MTYTKRKEGRKSNNQFSPLSLSVGTVPLAKMHRLLHQRVLLCFLSIVSLFGGSLYLSNGPMAHSFECYPDLLWHIIQASLNKCQFMPINTNQNPGIDPKYHSIPIIAHQCQFGIEKY